MTAAANPGLWGEVQGFLPWLASPAAIVAVFVYFWTRSRDRVVVTLEMYKLWNSADMSRKRRSVFKNIESAIHLDATGHMETIDPVDFRAWRDKDYNLYEDYLDLCNYLRELCDVL